MKNLVFIIALEAMTLLYGVSLLRAQGYVGIGTTNPAASAVLDMTSTNSGLLVPRMTQSQRSAIVSPATGLLVYCTDSVNASDPATFYYYTGSAWVPFLYTGWLLKGNSGTTAGTNYLGTQDAQGLVMKTNNTERVRTSSTGLVGIHTSSPATYVDIAGDLATRYSTVTVSNGTNNDVAIGSSSFVELTGPTAAFTITGIAGGADGKVLTLYNSTSQQITISNESSSSLAANRIWALGSNADIVISGKGSARLIYSTADSRWLVIANSITATSTTTGVTVVIKHSDQSVTNDTALVNDNELYTTMPANDSVQIEGYIDQQENTNARDSHLAFTIPTGATMNIVVSSSNATKVQQDFLHASGQETINIDGNPATPLEQAILFFGTIVNPGAAGTIQLKWAQFKLGTDIMTFKKGSYLKTTLIR